MRFLQDFLLVASALFIGAMSAYAFTHRHVHGASEVCFLGIFAIFWTVGSFFEIEAATLSGKLFWRDVQQIGVFGLPIFTVKFAVTYTMSRRLNKVVYAGLALSALTVLLIFTDPVLHIMRSSYALQDSLIFGRSLVVESTTVGMILVAYNFSLPLFAILLLLNFARKLAPAFRRQVYWIVGSFLFTFLAAFLKTAVLEEMGIFIHISVLYIPSAMILFLSLFRYSFFRLSPIARDKVFEVVDYGILVTDRNGFVLEANSAAVKIAREENGVQGPLTGRHLREICCPGEMADSLLSTRTERKEEIVFHKEEGDTYLSLDFYPLGKGQDGSVLIIRNITNQKACELNLRRQADTDALTGLLNRSGFENSYEQVRAALREQRKPLSLFMLDLDNFKSINDTFGHVKGDEVLIHFAQLLRTSLREEDVVGRIGGEEFAILLPGMTKEEAIHIAERIRTKVCQAEQTFEGNTVRYTVSIGVTDNCVENNCLADRALEQVLLEADTALYQAKHLAKNRTVVFG